MEMVVRRASLALAVVAVIAVAAALWAGNAEPALNIGGPGGSVGQDPGIRSIDSLFDANQPLMVDVEKASSYSEAVNKADFTIAVPRTLPEGVERTEVWYSDVSGEVAMRYGDSLVIEYVPWVADGSPAKEYANSVEQYGAGELATVAGQPAWVVPAGSAGEGQPPVAEVHVAVNGVEITFYGKMSIDELVTVADSLYPVEKVMTGIAK